ncbi:hypothetical protein JHK85_040724 [Glycine max]|nr:hypothetical protein JHK85_040724 [Glycine max]
MSSTCKCSPRETIHVVKEVRVALVVVMNPMTNNSMDSIVLFGDNFKDLNNKCNTIGHASKKSKCNSEQNKKTQEGIYNISLRWKWFTLIREVEAYFLTKRRLDVLVERNRVVLPTWRQKQIRGTN